MARSSKNSSVFSLVWLMFVAALLVPSASADESTGATEVTGAWLFTEMIYQGQRRLPLSSDLYLCMEYFSDGASRVIWFRRFERGFCERRGRYAFTGTHLQDEITEVNPDNNMDCGRDPDMVTGRKTVTPVSFDSGQLHMHMTLGDEPLIYILSRMETCPATAVPPP